MREKKLSSKEKKLLQAAQEGDLKGVEESFKSSFLSAAANVNVSDGMTALHRAVQRYRLDIINCLLKQGADMNVLDDIYGYSPLYMAVRDTHYDMIQLLVEHGANVNLKNKDGQSPLGCIAQNYMINDKRKRQIELLLIKNGANPNVMGEFGNTMLGNAITNRDESYARLLIEHQADVTVKVDKYQNTALLLAYKRGLTDLVLDCMLWGVDVNEPDETGLTPLMFAAQSGDLAMAELFIEKGADLFAENKSGRTAMMYAVGGGHIEMIKFLEKQGLDIHQPDNDGITPFIYAAMSHRTGSLNYLALRGANIDAQDKDGNTAYILAARNDNVKIMKCLNELGVDIEIQNKVGKTAFLTAAYEKKYNAVQYIIESGLVQYNKDLYRQMRSDVLERELRARSSEELIQLPETEPGLWYRTVQLRKLSLLLQLIPDKEQIKMYEKAQYLISADDRKELQQLIRANRGRTNEG